MRYVRDFTMPAFWAGITAFVWYAFGTVPLQIAVASALARGPAETSSWIFVVWFTGGIASIVLTLAWRIPLPITWTIPGIVYLGTLAGRFDFAQIVGANLMAGLLILALGLAGVGERIIRWLPLPIVMGMFGGSVLGYVVRLVEATVADVTVAGATVAGFLLGRVLASPRIPPLGLAVAAGGLAVVLAGRAGSATVAWSLPTLTVPEMAFSVPAFVAITLPIVVLTLGLGNVQGLGFLLAQGYRVPVRAVTVAVGVSSVLNALLGGHAAIVARTGVAILASPEAGPAATRYWSSLIASALVILLALAAEPMSSLIGMLPGSYVAALAGLAILSAFQDALEQAFTGALRFGALVAFGVAATPFAVADITSAFWAVLAGVAASAAAERRALFGVWRAATTA
jgi:benzoate membrane transport protein